METLKNIWDWATLNNPITYPVWVVVALLVVGATFAITPELWKRLTPVATWFHEMGHATVALMFGRTVSSVKIHKDASGVTEHYGNSKGLPLLLITSAGYPAPSIVGTLILIFVLSGAINLTAATFFVFGVISLFFQGNFRGFIWTALVAITALLLTLLPTTIAQGFALVIAGFLIAASPVTIFELHRYRQYNKKRKNLTVNKQEKRTRLTKKDENVHSDADTLASRTAIPAVMWEVFFFAVSVAVPATAVYLLAKR